MGESFPCMSTDLFLDILDHARRLLKPNGALHLYHNLHDESTTPAIALALISWIKPRIKYFLGVDFGRLTTVSHMHRLLAQASIPADHIKDEVLLSAKYSEARITFAGVSNHWHRFCGSILVFFN